MSLLTIEQKNFLQSFFQTYLGTEFFLSGGTALAEYYLLHRLSQDLDLFTSNQDLPFDSVNAEVLKIVSSHGLTIENQVTSETFLRYILASDENILKIDIIKDTPPHFGKVENREGVRIDSLENIAVGKLLALFGRADPKDFVDLYFLFEKEKIIGFSQTLILAKKKDLGLQEIYLAEMLSKSETIEIFPPTIKEYQVEKLRQFFTQLAEKLLLEIKPS